MPLVDTTFESPVTMNSVHPPQRSVVATTAYRLLDPIPYGFFVAALIFDSSYARSGEVMWNKSAAWLIAVGLLFAVIPRTINLVQVWLTARGTATSADKSDSRDQPLNGAAHGINGPLRGH